MRLEIVRYRCFSKTPVSGTAILLVLQRFCNEEGRAGTKMEQWFSTGAV